MAEGGKVNWYGDQVLLRVKDATQEVLDELALVGEGKAKANVVANDQVDTGFMLNTVYAVTSKSERETWQSGEYHSRKTGQTVSRTAAPHRTVDANESAIACAAEYAVHQELDNSFLYRALEQLQGEAGGVIERVGKEKLR